MDWVRHFRSLTAVLALLVAGCAKDTGPTYYTVTGQVMFESEPVLEGSIIFMPSDDPSLPPVGGAIADGKYTLKAYPGAFKVKISASKENPEKTIISPGGDDVLIMEEYIPEKYNKNTELTADVEPTNSNAIDFELTK